MNTIRILHVEDDSVDSDWFARVVDKMALDRAIGANIDIVQCARLAEAQAALRREDAEFFNLVVLDLTLPGSTPSEVFHLVTEAAAGIPVVVLSAHSQEEMRRNGLASRVHAFVCKNESSPAFLSEVLRSALDVGQAQMQLRSIIHGSADGMVVVDGTGIIRFANRAAAALFGISLADLQGQAFGAPVVGGEWAEIRVGADRVAEMRVVDIEWEGRPAHLASLRDVTARRKIESDLRDSEERLRSISNSAPDAIVSVDGEGGIVGWNPAAERMFGIPEAAALGRPVSDLVALEDAPHLVDTVKRFHGTDPGAVADAPLLLRGSYSGGGVFPMEASFGAWRTSGGAYTSIFLRNVADRLRAEQRARDWAAIFEYCAWGAVVAGAADGRIRMVNPGLATMVGVPESELIGRPVLDLFPNSVRLEVTDRLAEAEKHGSCRFETVHNTATGGHVPALVDVTVVRSQPGADPTLAVHIHDITDRKKLEQQLSDARRLESIGRFAGGVAHDFNNLLTAILGQADFLMREVPEGHPMRRQAGEIREAGLRAAELTSQLLAFGRRQPNAPRVLDLGQTVSGTLRLLRHLIGEHIDLRAVVPPDLGMIRADPTQMEQIIVNLVANARDAMPNGGSVTLEVGNVELDDSHGATHETVPPGPYVMLAVSDTGTGMDSDTVSRVFEPFFTTKEQGKGTGLGLATVYGIVKQSSGHIFVYSEPGCGTSFKLYFPRTFEARETASLRTTEASTATRGTETVLVVEDERVVREIAVRALTSHGYTVVDAARPSVALELRSKDGFEVDLVLTDVVMPEMNGPELVELLHKRWPNAKVLYMSGYTSGSLVTGHSSIDAGKLLSKPFTPRSLARKVREVLDERHPAGEGPLTSS